MFKQDRRGRVFAPINKDALPYAPSRNVIGPIVSSIGEKAGIIVGQRAVRMTTASL